MYEELVEKINKQFKEENSKIKEILEIDPEKEFPHFDEHPENELSEEEVFKITKMLIETDNSYNSEKIEKCKFTNYGLVKSVKSYQRVVLDALKEYLKELVNHILFEFNDEETRLAAIYETEKIIKSAIPASYFLDYKIICDETNNTPKMVEKNECLLNIHFYISKFEFVDFSFKVMFDSETIPALSVTFGERLGRNPIKTKAEFQENLKYEKHKLGIEKRKKLVVPKSFEKESMDKWLKEMNERFKEIIILNNAHLHHQLLMLLSGMEKLNTDFANEIKSAINSILVKYL